MDFSVVAPDQGDGAKFPTTGRKPVLLGSVEAMDFVHEQQRALPDPAAFGGVVERPLQDRRHRRRSPRDNLDERELGLARQQPGDGGLAGRRAAPTGSARQARSALPSIRVSAPFLEPSTGSWPTTSASVAGLSRSASGRLAVGSEGATGSGAPNRSSGSGTGEAYRECGGEANAAPPSHLRRLPRNRHFTETNNQVPSPRQSRVPPRSHPALSPPGPRRCRWLGRTGSCPDPGRDSVSAPPPDPRQ